MDSVKQRKFKVRSPLRYCREKSEENERLQHEDEKRENQPKHQPSHVCTRTRFHESEPRDPAANTYGSRSSGACSPCKTMFGRLKASQAGYPSSTSPRLNAGSAAVVTNATPPNRIPLRGHAAPVRQRHHLCPPALWVRCSPDFRQLATMIGNSQFESSARSSLISRRTILRLRGTEPCDRSAEHSQPVRNDAG